jgi:hypothetical protein
VIDVVTSAGEAALVWGTALMGMSKDKSSVELAMTQRDRALMRLKDWAQDRLTTWPQRTYVEEDEDTDGPFRDGDWRYDR